MVRLRFSLRKGTQEAAREGEVPLSPCNLFGYSKQTLVP